MTKAERSAKAKRTAGKRRKATAVRDFLKKMNPSGIKHLAGARVKRNAGGSITVIPIKLRRMNSAGGTYIVKKGDPMDEYKWRIQKRGSGHLHGVTNSKVEAKRIAAQLNKRG